MFDIDGTLIESYQFDGQCYQDAVFEILGQKINPDWSSYPHVTDTGILDHHLLKMGLQVEREEILRLVKLAFISKVEAYLRITPVKQIAGAGELINNLRDNPQVSLSIATGGWLETALLKLHCAGIEVTDIPLASADDHFSRTEIMKLALQKTDIEIESPCTYFGDALWDRQACEALAISFVLVGDRIEHRQNMADLVDIQKAYKLIGIENS